MIEKTAYINQSPEEIKHVAESVLKEFPDSCLSLAPIFPKATYAPSKSHRYFRITCDIAMPIDAIVGEDALTDFGAMVILRLPKSRIEEKFLNKEGAKP